MSIDKKFIDQFSNVTIKAAFAASQLIGKKDKIGADKAATDSMRNELNKINMIGEVVIGEGELDEAPMLYIGEEVGKGGPKVDIALDPLEGTTITAQGGENALSVLAMGEEGSFLHCPDIYMYKIAYGKKYESLDIDPESPSDEIVKNFAKYSGIKIENIVVCVLDRPRHKELIDKVRSTGARIKLIADGDVSAVIATSFEDSGVDIYMGIGGSPEGVLAAAALRCIGGKIYTKLIFDNDKQIERAKLMGISDSNRIYLTNDLASGDVMFSATGVTDGTLLKGVLIKNEVATTQSVVMRSKTKTVRYVSASHDLRVKDIVK